MGLGLVVVGAQWGDEGKGKLVDWFAHQVDAVVRFQGGHNAGHTILVGDQKMVLHLIPSGVFCETVSCLVIGPGVVVSLEALTEEIRSLEKSGIVLQDRLKIALGCPLVLPFHQQLDYLLEKRKGQAKIGTTGRGIGPAYEDQVGRRAVHVFDLLHPDRLLTKLQRLADYHNVHLQSLGGQQVDVETTHRMLVAMTAFIAPMIADVSVLLNREYAKKWVLFEGAQGTLLDIHHGTYPYVTSSSCVAGAACVGAGVSPRYFSKIIGVAKAYCTRVGSGPFPTELHDEVGKRIQQQGLELGATTARVRRCGWFDVPAMKRSIFLNGFSALSLMKLDVLDTLDEIKVCTHYLCDGERVDIMPVDIDATHVSPQYKYFPGWKKSIQHIRNFEQLPKETQYYVRGLEELLDVPISFLSVGSQRAETIVLDAFIQ